MSKRKRAVSSDERIAHFECADCGYTLTSGKANFCGNCMKKDPVIKKDGHFIHLPQYSELSAEQKKIADDFGYHGLFASKENMDEAGKYMRKILDSLNQTDKVAVTIGIQVLVNSMAIEMAKRG
jgi:hypothetical protein